MAPSHILQIFLRVTVQNQIGIRQWVIVDEVVQFCLLRHGHIQHILDPGAVNGDFFPSRNSNSTQPVSMLNLQALSSYFIIIPSKSCYWLTVYDKVSEFCAVHRNLRCCTRRKQKIRTLLQSETGSDFSCLVGAGGFEPPKLKAADLQSVPIGHSGTRPYSFVSAARTACIYYHAQSSLSTIFNRFYRNLCTNLSNKLAPWKNRPEINVPERFFLELVTGVEPATH